ncbi:MAG: CoA transferase [Bradyrhizobiaceae bacterium]|nr:CoA transferase [Bradyrhizobiaceae bacterium]
MSGNYSGPLAGLKVVEFAGIGPGPFCGMLLAQLGADVLRIERPVRPGADTHELLPIDPRYDLLNRGKVKLALDMKSPAAIARIFEIVEKADCLIEGFRPGVMERLGLGPDVCLARNPRLIYGRVTGWGQSGPLAQNAGHDITYIALSGALAAIGERNGPPVPPLNLVGDFAGGGLYLAIGLLAAREEARRTGRGQVIDAAMLDGATHLMTFVHGLRQAGFWSLQRGSNQPDGGFPFNAVYRTSDRKWIAVAAAEMKFRAGLVSRLGLPAEIAPAADDPSRWPDIKTTLAGIFARHPREYWCRFLEGPDNCVAPVLDLDETMHHPHVQARGLFVEDGDLRVPAPAPKFSNGIPAPAAPNADTLLVAWNIRRS